MHSLSAKPHSDYKYSVMFINVLDKVDILLQMNFGEARTICRTERLAHTITFLTFTFDKQNKSTNYKPLSCFCTLQPYTFNTSKPPCPSKFRCDCKLINKLCYSICLER